MQDLYGWFNRNLRGRKGQQGFTLIELLVVVTILGILAAIVTLSLVGLTNHANVQACNSEYKTVQAALDAYIADNQLSTSLTALPTPAAPTNNMSTTVPLYNANPSAASPNYTRNGTTQFYYMWDASGKITAITSDNNPPPNLHTITGCQPT
ncbi:MAG TPA: prepilin-type N-terminal cleavage/methylation domain-containing protein [Candidatus Dormibacteraeota bacterium]|nr:prepilin-type N-terminal cleavage/methylation domain-containing protein [Candidatus Dormibacteraeota bacterium]